jgi:hypothetical protein
MTYACDGGQMVRARAEFKAGEFMISDPLSSPARDSWLVRIFLAGMLVLVVCEASFGQSAEVQHTQPSGQIADGGFPAKPLHPAKIVIQLAVVGGLMMLWTFRPERIHEICRTLPSRRSGRCGTSSERPARTRLSCSRRELWPAVRSVPTTTGISLRVGSIASLGQYFVEEINEMISQSRC